MPKRTSPKVLDPLELPFTQAEILEAASLIWPSGDAEKFVQTLAHHVPAYIRWRARKWAMWRQSGVRRRDGLGGIALPEEILAALTVISKSAAARVKKQKRALWKGLRSAFINSERHAAAKRLGLIPTKRQVLAQLRKAGLSTQYGVMIRVKGMPRVTRKMVASAEARLQVQVRKWEVLCRRIRVRTRVDGAA